MTDINVCCICKGNNDDIEVTKQRCNHIICWKCLQIYVQNNLSPRIKCPGPNCARFLSDSAIRKVLSDLEVQLYEQMMIYKLEENVKCLLPECPHVYLCSDRNVQFDCPVCSIFNCLMCNAPHKFLSCDNYKSGDEGEQYCQMEITRVRNVLKQYSRSMNREMFLAMDNEDLLIDDKVLECPICCRNLSRGDAIILRCSHLHCRYCLHDHIMASNNIPIICQADNCNKVIQEREIFKLITEEELAIYVDRCNSCVKGKLGFTFQCQSPNCIYFVEYSVKPDTIDCPLCKCTNCTKCYAIHTNETCGQFKERIKNTPYGKNLLIIEEKILQKKIMRCLKCHQILEKIRGCSWIQCSSCKFEMCWALQMRRWGPKGRGDTSDGCKCKVGGKYCTEDCGSCIPHNS